MLASNGGLGGCCKADMDCNGDVHLFEPGLGGSEANSKDTKVAPQSLYLALSSAASPQAPSFLANAGVGKHGSFSLSLKGCLREWCPYNIPF